ncbi:MAG: peptidyl-prolyl cis-trans isomerase [Methyloligellaceae bacterium]
MLNTLRKGAAGWAAKILIGLLILAFASWGLAGIFDPNSNRVLATVGDEKITPQEYERYERQIQLAYRLPPEILRASRAGILNSLIDERLVDVHAKDLNLGVPQEILRREIVGNRNFRDSTGEFNRLIFQRFIEELSMDERLYVETLRRSNLREQIVGVVTRSTKIPEQLLLAQHQYDNEARVLDYFVIDKKAIAGIKAPKEEVLQDQYEKTKERYKAPEYRKVAFLHLSVDALKGTFKIPEKEIKAAYESLKKKYTKPEKRKLLQISFPDLKKAEEAYKKLSSGKKFEDVASEYGQKQKDIDLGEKTKSGILDKAVADAAFALKKGKFSKPVKGTLNTVIVMATDITKEQVTPLDKVSGEISDKLAGEKAKDTISKLEKLIQEDTDEGLKLQEIAKKHSVTYSEVDIDSNGLGVDGKAVSSFPRSSRLLKEVFETDEGTDNDPVNVKNGIVWFDVKKITSSRTKTFEEVKKQISDTWIADEERKALDAKVKELLERLKKGEAIAAVAKITSSKVVTSKPVKRTGVGKELTAGVLKDAFDASLKQVMSGNTSDKNERIVFQVTEIQKAKPLDDKGRTAIKAKLSQSMAGDMFKQYKAGLRSEYHWKQTGQLTQASQR